MAVTKITEKTVATSVKNAAHILVTQPENVDGATVESLRRAPLNMLKKALGVEGVPEKVAEIAGDVTDLKSQTETIDDEVHIKTLLNGWNTVNWETGYIDGSGNVTSNPSFRHTDYIPVSEGDTISYDLYGYGTTVYIVTGYDNAKTKVQNADVVGASAWTEGTYTVPSGVAYVRICSGSITSANLYFTSNTVYGTVKQTLKSYVDEQDAKKVNIQQSISDAGKALVIGNDGKVVPGDVSITIDDTLTQAGEAADAKSVGDAIDSVAIKQFLNGWNTVDNDTGYVNSDGTITPNNTFYHTEYIPVTEGNTIAYNLKGYSNSVYIVTGYDSGKNRVANASVLGSSSFVEGVYTVPAGVAYVRLCSGTVGSSTFSSSTVYGKNANTKEYIDSADDALSGRIDGIDTTLASIDIDAITSMKANYKVSPNLLDPTKTEPATSLGAGYVYTDYMPVTAGNRYTIWANGQVYQLYWYDTSKIKIGSNITINGIGGEHTAPVNAVYARLSYKAENITNIMFACGVIGDYMPFGALIPNETQPDYVVRDTNNLNNPNKYVLGCNVSTTDGSITVYSSNNATDFIPVETGESYYFGAVAGKSFNRTGAAAYNENYEFVEAITSNTYTASEGVSFIRIGYTKSDVYSAPCVRKGNTGVTGLSSFDSYDSFRIVNTKPTIFEQDNGIYGLKWNAMGDSITEGSGTTKSYMTFIAERTGVIPRGYGVSNTAIARRGESYTNDMCIRYSAMDDDADIITVFGGTNDHGNHIPIGVWGDTTEYTLYGAMKILCEGLINKYMGKKIGFITPLPKYTNDTDFSYPSSSFMPYIECIKDVCKRYSIPVLDLYTESGIAPVLSTVRAAMIPDGLHPNAVGHELISWQIQRFLERL